MRIPEALYQQFCRAMPLACVDLILVDRSRRALPYLRESHPARGRWWSPGAALVLETRQQAALRKLRETSGIRANGAAGTTFDAQSAVSAWSTPDRSRQAPLHDFVLAGLSRLEASLE